MRVMGFIVDRESQTILLVKKDQPQAYAGKFAGVLADVSPDQDPAARIAEEMHLQANVLLPADAYKHRLTIGDCALYVAEGDTGTAAARRMGEFVVKLPIRSHFEREPVLPPLRWAIPMMLDPAVSEPVLMKGSI